MGEELLEADKYPTVDMFHASLFRIYAGKLQLDMLEHPFFSLQSRGRDMSTLKYTSNDGLVSIEISPSRYGRATMKDSDFIAYLQAKLVKMREDGVLKDSRPVEMVVEVSEFLEFANRDKSGPNYKNFETMLYRVEGTRIKISYTQVGSNGENNENDSTAIISNEWKMISSKKENMPLSFKIKINEWFVKPIVEGSRFLTIPRDYFLIKRDLHKRFYQISRKHANGFFEISWTKFYNKIGTPEAFSKFRSKVRKEFKDNNGVLKIMSFEMSESECGKKVIIKSRKQKSVLEVEHKNDRITGNNTD